ncbi:MAG: DNA polymerase III subunit alpha, partial [Planctomycetia bacterium]|nr:DNA polymerase III subunit alpha [Planctomycetia bacterium]
VNQLTKMIPQVLNISIDDALAQNADFRKEYETDPQVRDLLDIARKLEGTNRNVGTHAAGVVISNGPLTNYVPLQKPSRGDASAVTTQWVMGDLEKVGLLKMDFLGLRTLTLLDNCVKLIQKTRGEDIDLFALEITGDAPPVKKTYELLQSGRAKGVFQLESDGIRELLKRMKPDNIRDLIAIMALYRPGPLQGGMVDAYVNRKHGREKPTYQHEMMKEILEETHGVIVYQEQCMRILNRLGGIELASAYACVKAISKKKQDIIDQRKAEFIKGGVERGVSEETAREIFDLITFFAGYGFNKSHTAAYAQVGYQTAYLKANYTPEFMAALLSSEIDDSNKRDIMVEHIRDAEGLGVEVLPPNVNASDVEFSVVDGKIVFGLTAIKGVGRGAAAEIVRAREEKGPYHDLFDLCERVDLKLVPKAALEKLIKAGGCDCFKARRAQLWEVLGPALQGAADMQQDRKRGQGSLFGDSASANGNGNGNGDGRPAPILPDVPEWSNGDRLKFEKEALDFYFSSHPLVQHEEDLLLSSHKVEHLKDVGANQEVCLGGMLTGIRFQNTKKARNGNSRYARCKLEDLTGAVECVMWPDDFVRFKDHFVEDKVCFVTGVVEHNREEPGLVLTGVLTVEQARARLVKRVWLQLVRGEHRENIIDAIVPVLRKAKGERPVILCVSDGAGRHATLKVDQEFYVNPLKLDREELMNLLGPSRVRFSK